VSQLLSSVSLLRRHCRSPDRSQQDMGMAEPKRHFFRMPDARSTKDEEKGLSCLGCAEKLCAACRGD